MCISDYFEQTNCKDCDFSPYCSHAQYTGGVLGDPFCACTDEDRDHQDCLDELEERELKRTERAIKKAEEEKKKEETQRKPRTTRKPGGCIDYT